MYEVRLRIAHHNLTDVVPACFVAQRSCQFLVAMVDHTGSMHQRLHVLTRILPMQH